jgi:hypothetical protein
MSGDSNPQTPPNKKVKKGISGFFYALFRCVIEGNAAPLSDYVESEWDTVKYILKNCLGVCIIFLLASGYFCYWFYNKGHKNGWDDSQNAMADAFQRQLNPTSLSDRENQYKKWMQEYDGDSLNLSLSGRSAFKNEDYDWTIKFDRSAFEFKGKPVFEDSYKQDYVYYAGALFIEKQDIEANRQLDHLLKSIDSDIAGNTGRLKWGGILGDVLTKADEVRFKLPDEDKHYIDTFRDQVKNRLNGDGIVAWPPPEKN